jgi:hypothetical protein
MQFDIISKDGIINTVESDTPRHALKPIVGKIYPDDYVIKSCSMGSMPDFIVRSSNSKAMFYVVVKEAEK